jgi:integrase/recombinase XerD
MTVSLRKLFDEYLTECRYLKNFSPRTLNLYQQTFQRWARLIGVDELPNAEATKQWVIAMRQSGLSPVTTNIAIRQFNAFLAWLRLGGHIDTPRIPHQSTTKREFKVFSDDEIDRILAFQPKTRNERRIYALVALLIDSGARITEALTIRLDDVDLDNLTFRVIGKGDKERVIPMTIEMRVILSRYISKHRFCQYPSPWLFCCASGSHLTIQNARRDFLTMLKRCKIDAKNVDSLFHSLRRKFAKSYIQNGGDLAYAQQIMGHSTLAMTRHYVQTIEPEALKLAHQKRSLLSKVRGK